MTHRDSADSSDCHWSAERPNREMTACISCLSPCLRKVLAAAVQQIVNFWPFVNPIRKVPLCGGKRYYRWRKQCPQEVRCQAKTSRPDEWGALSFLSVIFWFFMGTGLRFPFVLSLHRGLASLTSFSHSSLYSHLSRKFDLALYHPPPSLHSLP